jgi:ribosomal protein S18 acetylase RimI-like enzyme
MVAAMGGCDGIVEIRPASEDDARGIAEVRVRTWQKAYSDIMPAEFLEGLSVDAGERRWRELLSAPTPDHWTLVAESAHRVVGFVSAGVPRDEGLPKGAGEVYAIYVIADCWNRGVGRALLGQAEQRLTEQGFDQAVLWVLADNQRARAFYEGAGWHADGGTKQAPFGGREVSEVRYRVALGRAGRAP